MSTKLIPLTLQPNPHSDYCTTMSVPVHNVTSHDPCPDLEEVEGLHGSVVQPHVLAQVQSGQVEGVEVGFIRQQLQEAHHCSQAGHCHL